MTRGNPHLPTPGSDRSLREATDLDALRVQTEERLAQSERLFATTRDARAWEDYRRAVIYFEDVLATIEEARRGR